MTSPSAASGTDRVAEVARGRRADAWVNLQGDEPLMAPENVDRAIETLLAAPERRIATLTVPLEPALAADPNVVKAAVARDGRALYFSRSPIPFHRGSGAMPAADFRDALATRPGELRGYLKHQGIYAYTPAALFALRGMAPSPLERDEGLEQLRALQAGFAIQVLESDWSSLAVDTPEDLARAAARLEPKEIER